MFVMMSKRKIVDKSEFWVFGMVNMQEIDDFIKEGSKNNEIRIPHSDRTPNKNIVPSPLRPQVFLLGGSILLLNQEH